MTTVQSDYILRMIQMMGEVIAIALKLRKSGHLVEANETLTDALVNILPEHADLIEMADETIALKLLNDSRLATAYIGLLLERAAIRISMGHESQAEEIQRRSLRLMMISLRQNLKISVEGLLLWGRLTGLELQLILSEAEYSEWKRLDQLIQNETIQVL